MCLCNITWMSNTLTLFGILFCFFDNFSYCSMTSGKAKRSHLVRLFNPGLLNACKVVSQMSMSYKKRVDHGAHTVLIIFFSNLAFTFFVKDFITFIKLQLLEGYLYIRVLICMCIATCLAPISPLIANYLR